MRTPPRLFTGLALGGALALGPVGALLAQDLLGMGGDRPQMFDTSGPVTSIGFPEVDDLDLPAFQNWVAVDPQRQVQVNGSFAMAYRTHRHLLARHRLRQGRYLESELTVERRLGEFETGPRKQNLLGVMLEDVARAPAATAYDDVQDLSDALRRRLEGIEDNRGLSFALQSRDQQRRRHVFVYRADKQEHDGVTWWVCRFYDPHMPKGSANRRSSFRVRDDASSTWSAGPFASPGVEIQLARTWAEEADAKGQHPFGGAAVEADWVALEGRQLLTVDEDSAGWAWEYGEPGPLRAVSQAWSSFRAAHGYITTVDQANRRVDPRHDVHDRLLDYP